MTETEHSSKNSPWPIILAVIVLTVAVAAHPGWLGGEGCKPSFALFGVWGFLGFLGGLKGIGVLRFFGGFEGDWVF